MKKLSLILKVVKKHKVVVTLIVLAIIGLMIFNQTRARPQPSQTIEVKKQDIKSIVSGSGTLTGVATVNLHFQSGGKLFSLNVKAGNKVEKGQAVANLDATGQITSLNQAKNTLRDKEATLRKVYDDIHLFQYGNGGFGNVGTANETETQRAQRTAAEVAKDNAFEDVKQAQKALADTALYSPVAGIVLRADFIPGQNVTASDNIAQVADTQRVIFEAEVDEADSAKVSVGQKAEVMLDAYPDLIAEGAVSEIIPVTKLASSGATVVIVKITLDSPNISFIAGLNGQASIIQKGAKDVLTIPLEALREDNTVVLKQDGFQPRQVTLGIKSDTDVEIKTGLNEGDQIILNPPAEEVRQRVGIFGGFFRILGGGRGR